MREKLTIRCGRKQFKKLNNEFFNSAWIKEKHDFGVDEIYVISNYLDDKAYSIYIDSLKELCKIDSVGLYSCAYIDRVYTKREIENTKLFLFKFSPSAMFEPAGEEVGTCYDESKACPQCKAGRVQVGDLILNLSRIPKNKDFCFTIAWDEWIVSERIADIMEKEKITDYELGMVKHYTNRLKNPPRYYQLKITSDVGSIISPTQFGMDLLNPDKKVDLFVKNVVY